MTKDEEFAAKVGAGFVTICDRFAVTVIVPPPLVKVDIEGTNGTLMLPVEAAESLIRALVSAIQRAKRGNAEGASGDQG